MKKKAIAAIAVFLALALAGLLGMYFIRTGGVLISIDDTQRHSEGDIRACLERVRLEYATGFDEGKLLRLRYDESFGRKWETKEAENYDGRETIIILADFATGRRSGALNPGSIYTDYKWIFVRNRLGIWELAGSGYA